MMSQVFSKKMHSLLMKAAFYALLVLAFAQVSSAQYTLPLYEILIDTCYLAQLDSFPTRDMYFPARFAFESDTQNCEVRYRGGNARLLPKKSWKVNFPIVGPDGRRIHNLNADYHDNSKMRNHLTMELFRMMECPSSLSKHISLKLNGVYVGVYTDIEQVDEQFIERNGFSIGPLWKAMRHGARFSPIIDYDRYPSNYECKIGDVMDFSELQELLCFCHYASPDEFESGVLERFDIENILDFYAIQFAARNLDGMSKNYYLHRNFDGNHWRMFPWDCDATFGNYWDGTWQGGFEDINITGFSLNTLVQRLFEREDFQSYFQLRIHELGSWPLDSLATMAQQTYNLIRHDVYLDTLKSCSNDEFDSEQDSLLLFLSRRAAFLSSLNYFNRTRLDDVWVSSDWLTDEDDDITFRVRAVEPVSAIDLYLHEPTGAFRSRIMYDDGEHDDLDAGDGIYGRVMS
ncbi:CotH kinase family protein, partial [bacterium]|nr:CotH kinase family protein [bacterium]